MKVAFDVDGTLIDLFDKPRLDVIAKLREHQDAGDEVYVWSGGGMQYALMVAQRLRLENVICVPKDRSYGIDICYDDCVVDLAKKNIRV